MSARLTPEQTARIRLLTQAVYHERATEDERAELRRLIEGSREAAWIYSQYMHLFAALHWDMRQPTTTLLPTTLKQVPSGQSPVLGFLGDVFHAGASFLSRSFVLTLLLAIALPALVLTILLVDIARQPVPTLPKEVARIVGAHHAVWGNTDGELAAGAILASGQELLLEQGLVEISFVDGARVVLEAPTTFRVRGHNAGFLRQGRLVANVPQSAHGFTVETPTATVVDLGTEFGIRVGPEGTAEAHVFDGQIEVALRSTIAGTTSQKELIVAGEAARIELSGARRVPQLDRMVASRDEFVQRFPSSYELPKAIQHDPNPASGRLIQSVNRRGGIAANRVPVGAFDGETDPVATDDTGLQDGAFVFSDRLYKVESMDPELIGADYVRTYLSDKSDVNLTPCYDVTFSTDQDEVFIIVLVDDRFSRGGRPLGDLVDKIVSRFAKPGEFVDTGFDVNATDMRTVRSLSAFGKTVPTKDGLGNPITYTFNVVPGGLSTLVIAAMPKAPKADGSK